VQRRIVSAVVVRERGGTPFRQISLATGGTLTLKRSGKLPPNAGFGIKNLKKISSEGDTPRIPSAGGGDSLPHPSPAGKPFPQIKIYHCYYYYYYYYCVCPSVCLSVPPGLGTQRLGQLGAQRLGQVSRDVQTADPSTHA